MKKSLAIISIILALVLAFASCAGQPETTTANNSTTVADSTTAVSPTQTADRPEINIGFLKGPTGMGAAKLLDDNAANSTQASYNVTLGTDPTVFQSALINGTLDIAALPTNVTAVLNSKTEGKIKLLAVNTLGVIYIMDNSGAVSSIADLKGKTILSAGQGTTTEYVLNYILEKNGLTVGTDVTVEYAVEHAEVITKAVAGNYSVVLLPEPFVTQMKGQDAGFKTVIDLTDEWTKAGGGELTMGSVAVRSEFLDKNPSAVAAFLADYSASVKYVNENTDAAAELIEKYEIAKAKVASVALPNCNITLITGDEMKTAVQGYLSVLYAANAQSVGGSLPGDGFYAAFPAEAE